MECCTESGISLQGLTTDLPAVEHPELDYGARFSRHIEEELRGENSSPKHSKVDGRPVHLPWQKRLASVAKRPQSGRGKGMIEGTSSTSKSNSE